MALTFPYPLPFLSDRMQYTDLTLDLQRFDEMSGSGDGRQWAAQLATPLWRARANLRTVTAREGKLINARAMALDGPSKTFLFADPTYTGPASGPYNWIGTNVTIAGVRSDRGAITLAGLPPEFVLTEGDFLSIEYSGGRVYFGQFLEGGTAGSAGNIQVQKEVRPYLPFGVGVGSPVVLVRPYFKAIIPSGGFTPYTFQPGDDGRGLAVGASITVLQKP